MGVGASLPLAGNGYDSQASGLIVTYSIQFSDGVSRKMYVSEVPQVQAVTH